MGDKAVRELIAFAALYSLAFIIPQAFIASAAEAQCVTAWLLPSLIIIAFVCIRHTGLLRLCGLEVSRTTLARILRTSLPYAPVLLVPFVNLLVAGSQPWQPSAARLVIILCAALFEELFFRGYLIGILLERGMRPLTTVVLSATTFACLHLLNAFDVGIAYASAQFLAAASMGVAFGFIRLSSDSVYPCMLVHLLMNLTASRSMLYDGSGLWMVSLSAIIVGAWSCLWWKGHAASKR